MPFTLPNLKQIQWRGLYNVEGALEDRDAVPPSTMNDTISKRPSERSVGAKACGSCHRRKIRCDLQAGEFPCSNCKAFGQECRPHERKRKRPLQTSSTTTRPPSKQRKTRTSWESTQLDTATRDPPSQGINGANISSKPAACHTSPGSYLGRAELFSNIVPIDEEDAKNYAEGRETDVPEIDMKFLNDLRAFEVPARSVRESLVSNYLDRCSPWMPIVWKSDLAQSSDNPPSMLLLQAVFVAGSRISLAPQAQSMGHAFYRRAKALYYSGAEKDPLTIIRAICILQWWNPSGPEHVSMDASSFWLHMGVALGHQVGLHREPNPQQPDAALRRRLWWTLFTRDCMISTSHGRPRALNTADTDVRPPSLSDFPPSYSEDQAHLFLAYVDICSILGDLTEASVRGNLSRSLRLNIETRLSTWISNLPESLHLHSQGGGLAAYNLLSRQLHVPYFTALTLFFRPTSPSTPPSSVALLSSSFNAGIFEDLLSRGDIRYLASTYVFHMMCAAITQLACYRYPSLWSKASGQLEILDLAMAEMAKRYPTAFGAQRVIRDVERTVRKQERHTSALQLRLASEEERFFKGLGPELCSQWDHAWGITTIDDAQVLAEVAKQGNSSGVDTVPSAMPSSNLVSTSLNFQDVSATTSSVTQSSWDGAVGSAEFSSMMATALDPPDPVDGMIPPFDPMGTWMISDWGADLGW